MEARPIDLKKVVFLGGLSRHEATSSLFGRRLPFNETLKQTFFRHVGWSADDPLQNSVPVDFPSPGPTIFCRAASGRSVCQNKRHNAASQPFLRLM